MPITLDLSQDVRALTAALVDVRSVSGDEVELTDAVESALRSAAGDDGRISVARDGNVVLARTDFGRPTRVVLAGHLDTVPIADNVPSHIAPGPGGDRLYGCGTSDMKSGDAVALRAAYLIATGVLVPNCDVTWVFYDCEEIEATRNGLGRIARENPAVLQGDLAILLEPTNGLVEGGCQGTMRAVVTVPGTRAHSARSWLGVNAIHGAGPVLATLASYEARTVEVEGLTYREGLNAVKIEGGVAGNVVPDVCQVTVNYRFAPDRSEAQAHDHVREVFAGFDIEITDSSPAARPGLDSAAAMAFSAAVGGVPSAKLGWTDVARFSELGIPALNFGPGDPNLAHTRHEYVHLDLIVAAEQALLAFLA
ncbi:MAG: dapE [Pseudonocardiales bacterium]|nr:dapE [Pseudonocardiales bacterium]